MAKSTIKKKDQLGIVLENFNDKFGLAMESFSVLTKEVNGLKGEFKKLDKKVEGLDKKVDGIDNRLDNFQTETNSKFETVFNYLSVLEPQGEKIENIGKRVIIIEKQLAKK